MSKASVGEIIHSFPEKDKCIFGMDVGSDVKKKEKEKERDGQKGEKTKKYGDYSRKGCYKKIQYGKIL